MTGRRRIRVLIGKPGLDGHDVGAKLLCRALRDGGMEVIYTGLRRSPEQLVKAAADEDVDVLGLSVLSGAHLPLCAAVAEQLRECGMAGELLWLVGGNVPKAERPALLELGVDAVFATGSDFQEIVDYIRDEVSP